MTTECARAGRSRLAAAVLSGLIPGLGHSWLGRPLRGAAWIALLTALAFGWLHGAAQSYDWARFALMPLLAATLALILDAARIAPRSRPQWRSPLRAGLSHLAFVIVVGFLLPTAVAAHASARMEIVVQPDETMAAAGIVTGDRITCEVIDELPPVGRLVAVPSDRGLRLLRVVALPGERFAVRNGVVVRNGSEWVADYQRPARSRELQLPERRLGPEEVAVLSDTRTAVAGSGVIAVEDVACRPGWILLPGDWDLLRIGRDVR